MSHEHVIYDTDGCFLIDPETREIISGSENLSLIQYDHNSERYSFSMPRFIDGHDMSLCNSVEIHFDNISRNKREVNSDVYLVDDLSISDDDDSTIIFTWLVSDSATQISGKLAFAIHFYCVSDDGLYDYAWHTSIFDSIPVTATKNNTAGLETEHSNFISQTLAKLDTISTELSDAKREANAYTDQNASALLHYIQSIVRPYNLTWNDGSYISKVDGSVTAEVGSSYCDFVSVEPGTKLIITNTMTSDTEYNVFYDSEQNFLSSFSTDNGSVVIVPDGAKYFRLSKHTADTITIIPEVFIKKSKATIISLPTDGWTGSNLLYQQTVSVPIVKENSQVELRPSPAQLQELLTLEISLTAANESGSVTVFAIGGKPISDYTMQIIVSEVELV